MTISKELLKSVTEKNRISLGNEALDRFDRYAELLLSWNEKLNLTAITDPEEIVYKHFLDSLMPLKYEEIPEGSSLIDVGTGAGFPGLALLIARPDLKVTLLDSTQKKLNAVADMAENLGLAPNFVHARAEEAGKDPAFREQFDFATARAVSNLRDLSEYCLPFVKKGGIFLAMKGPDIKQELKDARRAIGILGGEPEKMVAYGIDDKGERHLLFIRKTGNTPDAYPRPSAKMAKKPL